MTMLRTGLLATVIASAFALPVLAAELRPGESHAVLIKATDRGTQEVIDGRVWRCDGAECVAMPNDSDRRYPPVTECRNAARTLGKFSAYATGKVTLTDVQLAECAR